MFFERLEEGWLAFRGRERETVRVLIVDDEPSVCLLLSEVLASEGYSVDTAASVAEAKVLLEAAKHQLIVLDKNLPDGSGIDLLKARRVAGDETPFVVITGYPTAETIVDSLTAGASDYIAKPFTDIYSVLKRLESVIDARIARRLNDRIVQDLSEVLQAEGPHREQVSHLATRLFLHKKLLGDRPAVLIVEDNPAVAEVIRRALSGGRLSVEIAPDLGDATARVGGDDGPIAALLSVDLPEAVQTIKQLRKIDPLIEIVVTTGSTDPDLALGAVAAGAADYVLRPFEGLDVLKARMLRAVSRGKRRRLYLHLIETLYREARRAGSPAMERLLAALPSSPPLPETEDPTAASSSFGNEPEVDVPKTDLEAIFEQEGRGAELPLLGSLPPTPSVSVRKLVEPVPAETPWMDRDRRQHYRVEANLEVRFQPITDEGHGFGGLIYSLLRDISAGGMFILMEKPFPIGTRLSVNLDLGWGLDTVSVCCEVVRRVAPGKADPSRSGIGVKFEDPEREEVQHLVRALTGRVVPT